MSEENTGAPPDHHPPVSFELLGYVWTVTPLDLTEQLKVEMIMVETLAPTLGVSIATLAEGSLAALVATIRDVALGGGRVLFEFDSELEARGLVEHARHREEHGRYLIESPAVVSGELDLGDMGVWPTRMHSTDEPLLAELRDIRRAVVKERESPRPNQKRWTVVSSPTGDSFDLAHLGTLSARDVRIKGAWEAFLELAVESAAMAVRAGAARLAMDVSYANLLELFSVVILGKVYMTDQGAGNGLKQGQTVLIDDLNIWGRLLGVDPNAKYLALSRCLLATYAPAALSSSSGEPDKSELDEFDAPQPSQLEDW